MKLLLNANVYGWRMTGLMGKDGAWFIGASTRPKADASGLIHDRCHKDSGQCRAAKTVKVPE